ncbi:hypothetical protein [Spongorhabdus nitratireducens]
MDIHNTIVLSGVLYKVVSLIVGAFFGYLGYKLFIKGIWGRSGDLEASFKDNKLIVKQAAPGTFFALSGAIIICVTIYTGIDFKSGFKDHPRNEQSKQTIEIENDDLPEKPPF